MTTPPRVGDICVRILPGLNTTSQDAPPVRTYEVVVYTYVPLPIAVTGAKPARAPTEYMGFPFKLAGQLNLKWERYQDIFNQFFDGDKGLVAMYYRLRDALSTELNQWVDQVMQWTSPVTVWWSSETPELDDMPWEVLFGGDQNQLPPPRFNFVRGVPPERPTPVLPLPGPLRVLWSDLPGTPLWMRNLFQPGAIPGLEPIPFSDDLRQRLRSATSEGTELVHLCSGGSVSLAYEGIITSSKPNEPGLAASELSEILRGSRVSVVGLTPTELPPVNLTTNTDVPVAVYRAFAYLASSRARLPSMIAPVGPTRSDLSPVFWQTFYSNLASNHRLDASFAAAKNVALASTFALFMRHSHGKLFRTATQDPSVPSPARMATDLQISRDLFDQIQVLTNKYGPLPDYVKSFTDQEQQRQQSIESELDKWTATEAEE